MPRIREILRNQSGNFMIGTLAGSLIMFVVTGGIAAGIAGIFLFQQAITDKTDTVKEAALADSSLRSDIRWASVIAPVDDRTVEMTVPGQAGGCHISTWTIDSGTVSATVVDYPGYNATVTPVRCSGTPTAPKTLDIITEARATAFSYTNLGGRPMAYTAGTPALTGSGTAPAGTDPKAWASTVLGGVALDTVLTTGSGNTVPHRTAQSADTLNLVPEPADAASFFVPEGTLTIP